MMKRLWKYGFAVGMLLLVNTLPAQIFRPGKEPGGVGRPGGNRGQWHPATVADTSKANKTQKKKLAVYPLKEYKLYTVEGDTIPYDSLLNVRDLHRVNFTGRDIYALMPFQNMGQPLNRLLWDERDGIFAPICPRAQKYSIRTAGDLFYFRVPTPYTRLFFLTGNKKGQMLDSRFGINIRPNWNVGLGYRGINSLGYYLHSLTSQEFWYVNTAYTIPTDRGSLQFYLVKNHLENDENGGITDEQLFENPGTSYTDRGKIPVNSTSDRSIWQSRQTGGSFFYAPVKKLRQWRLGYRMDYVKAYRGYKGGTTLYGSSIPYPKDFDSVAYRDYRHRWALQWHRKTTQAEGGLVYRRFFRRFDSSVTVGNVYVPRSLLRSAYGVYARIRHTDSLVSFKLDADMLQNAYYAVALRGTYRRAGQQWIWKVGSYRREPEPVFRLWQSRFARFNWNRTWMPVTGNYLSVVWQNPWGDWKTGFHRIRHLPYFGSDSLPAQYGGTISILKFSYGKDWAWRKFHFYPELSYQKVDNGGPALDLPAWRYRVSLYYTDWWFTHHFYLNTGIRVQGFSSYHMAGYLPLTGTFYQQRQRRYGDFYIADLFFDFKVKKFYAYLIFSHFNALWEKTHPRYYSAPFYPYADEMIRLGIVWKFVN